MPHLTVEVGMHFNQKSYYLNLKNTQKLDLLLTCWRPWRSHGPLDPSKCNGKTNGFSTFSILGPIKAPHIPITLAI